MPDLAGSIRVADPVHIGTREAKFRIGETALEATWVAQFFPIFRPETIAVNSVLAPVLNAGRCYPQYAPNPKPA